MPVSADPPSAQAGRPVEAEDGYPRLAIVGAPPSERSGGLHPPLWPRRDESADRRTQPDGTITCLGIDEEIRLIEIGHLGFYVEISGQRVTVNVDTTPTGRTYLVHLCSTQPRQRSRQPSDGLTAVADRSRE